MTPFTKFGDLAVASEPCDDTFEFILEGTCSEYNTEFSTILSSSQALQLAIYLIHNCKIEKTQP
jgi:hypothetical protein